MLQGIDSKFFNHEENCRTIIFTKEQIMPVNI